MQKNKIIRGIGIALCVAIAMLLAQLGQRKTSVSDSHVATTDSPFIIDTMLRTPPITDQGHSPLCWVYAMLRTIEIDCLQEGDSVRLSPMYIARRFLEEQADKAYFAAHSGHSFDIGMRGMATDCLVLLDRYGAMPWQSYQPRDVNFGALCRHAADIARLSTSLKEMHRSLTDIIDEHLGYMPLHVFMLGAEYTMKEFSHSVSVPGAYAAFTSFTHHYFGSKFAIESPDNRYGVEAENVEIDSLLRLTVRSIRSGHAVCWEGDTSESSFRSDLGTATAPPSFQTDSIQRLRQRHYETGRTTDDHCLVAVGLAHDKAGQLYLVMQNSWGDVAPYHGLIYMSADYFRMKTMLVVMRKE